MGCPRASHIPKFNHLMDKFKDKHPTTYNWLSKRPPQEWSRSHFNTIPKCDILLNNLCKCFNKYILDARDKPILKMFETIKCKLMNRFYMNRNVVKKYEGVICPRIQKKLDQNKELSKKYWLIPSTQRKFQVKCPGNQYTIDLDERSCSCRK